MVHLEVNSFFYCHPWLSTCKIYFHTSVIAAIIRQSLQIIVPGRSWKRAAFPLGIVFLLSFDAGQRNITRIQELIGHNKVCVTFGQTDACTSVCVCKLFERYKCLNLGSILTTCHCCTWEMTAFHYLTLLWLNLENRVASPACVWGCIQWVNCKKVRSKILIDLST